MKRLLFFIAFLCAFSTSFATGPTPILTLVIPTGGENGSPNGSEEVKPGATLTIDAGAIINAQPGATVTGFGGGGGGIHSITITVPPFLSISPATLTSDGTFNFGLSGTPLPIVNGGTGSTSATGSGSVVLSTSPTLVTPALGAATATSINGISFGGGISTTYLNGAGAYTTPPGTATSGTSILQGNGSGGFSNIILGANLGLNTGTLSVTGLGALATLTPGTGVATAAAQPVNGNSGLVVANSSGAIQVNLPAITTALTGLAAVQSSDGTLGTIVLGSGLSYTTGTLTATGSGSGTTTIIATGASTGTATGTGTITLALAGGAGTFTGTFTGQHTGTFTGQSTGTFTGQSTGTFTGIASGTFTGPLTGNVTGNVSGSAGSLLNGPVFTASTGTLTIANGTTLTSNSTGTLGTGAFAAAPASVTGIRLGAGAASADTALALGSGVALNSGTLTATGSGGTITSLVSGTGITFNPTGTITSTGTITAATGTTSTTLAIGNDTRFPASVTGIRLGAGAGSSDTAVAVGTGLSLTSGTLTATGSELTAGNGIAITTGTISTKTTTGTTTIAATGTTTLSATGLFNSNAVALSTGTYVPSIVLSDSGVFAGQAYEIPISWAANVSGTVSFYDSSTGGTLINSIVMNGVAGNTTVNYINPSGSAWVKAGKGANLVYQNNTAGNSVATDASNQIPQTVPATALRAPTGSVVCGIGDSIMAGAVYITFTSLLQSGGAGTDTGGATGYGPIQLLSALPYFKNIPCYDYGVSGAQASAGANIITGSSGIAATEYINGVLVGTYGGITSNVTTIYNAMAAGGTLYVPVMYGANDSAASVTQATYTTNIQSIYSTAHALGSNVTVIGCTPSQYGSSVIVPLIYNYDQAVWLSQRTIANTTTCCDTVADMGGIFSQEGTLLTTALYYTDNKHYRTAGYQVFANEIYRSIISGPAHQQSIIVPQYSYTVTGGRANAFLTGDLLNNGTLVMQASTQKLFGASGCGVDANNAFVSDTAFKDAIQWNLRKLDSVDGTTDVLDWSIQGKVTVPLGLYGSISVGNTNLVGGDLTVSSGYGTGTGAGKGIIHQVNVVGTTGNTVQSLATISKEFNSGGYGLGSSPVDPGAYNIGFPAGNGILGGATSTLPSAGIAGYVVTNTVASGSAVSLTTATTANICDSGALAAGHYLASFQANVTSTTATMVLSSPMQAGISTGSATLPTSDSIGSFPLALTVGSAVNSIPVASQEVTLTGSGHIYGVMNVTFTAGTEAGYGKLTIIQLP